MKKKDLKNGDFVLFRNHELGEHKVQLSSDKGSIFVDYKHNLYEKMANYSEDLENKHSPMFDVISVRRGEDIIFKAKESLLDDYV